MYSGNDDATHCPVRRYSNVMKNDDDRERSEAQRDISGTLQTVVRLPKVARNFPQTSSSLYTEVYIARECTHHKTHTFEVSRAACKAEL